MKILIIGGTVFLGKHVVEAALSRGHEVTTFSRGLHDDGSFPEVEKLRGDRRADLNPLRGRRWDAVIDTCGYVPSAVGASAQILSDAVEHYTFISSQSVYANYDVKGLDENHVVQELTDEQISEAEAIKPDGGIVAVNYGAAYGGLKALCERAAEALMPGRTLNVRAGLIVGPDDYSDRFTYWVRRISQGGEVLAPGNQEQPVQLIDVRDLAEWILNMAERREAGTFNATGPDYKLTMKEMLETCRSASGSDAQFTWVSEEFLKEAKVNGWSEIPLWMHTEDSIVNFFSVDCSKAINAGLKFRPLMETARATLEWDRTRDPDAELRNGLKRDKEIELLEAWHSR